MENPEEVLQALDEFQKLRPSEIPKELEEYLCWVAKTGDPVYQWPLIKALFREKLLRVMTDFYESCPSLELAPCPNVKQFNYERMKCNLLDRLETFANAPFTVQRICELLTAPRKEYNRVDKFMRAMEKNMLVVLTREPGSAARRSENGDGMVNGSVEDNGHLRQSEILMTGHDVEMTPWVRECNSAATITVQTVEMDPTIDNMHNLSSSVIPATELTVVKNSSPPSETYTPTEKIEQELCISEINPKNQDMNSTFTPSTSEIASIVNLTSQIQPQDINSTSGIQNLSNMVPEASSIVGDVSEAIMNEDTNSQPSLDLENNDTDSFESARKLQTTFQSSDFVSNSTKSPKSYSDDAKAAERTIVEPEPLRTESGSLILEEKQTEVQKVTNVDFAPSSEHTELSGSSAEMTDDSRQISIFTDKTIHVETDLGAGEENVSTINGKTETIHRVVSDDMEQIKGSLSSSDETVTLHTNESQNSTTDTGMEKENINCLDVKMNTKDNKTADTTLVLVASKSPTPQTNQLDLDVARSIGISSENEALTDSNDLKIETEELKDVVNEVLPTAEVSKEIDDKLDTTLEFVKEKSDTSRTEERPETVIEEIGIEENTGITNSLVPDPLPIVEQPKDEQLSPDSNEKQIVADIINDKSDEIDKTSTSVDSKQIEISEVEEHKKNLETIEQVTTVTETTEMSSTDDSSSATQDSTPLPDTQSTESMEIDDAESSRIFEQDEPMEEDISDLDKS